MIAASPAISSSEFECFRQLIYDIAGIHLGENRQSMLAGRLGRRLRYLGLPSFDAYFRHLTGGADSAELQVMIDLITTNETYFFREQGHFDFLRKLAGSVPAGRPFRVWSAASSSGEEAYTMAMVLADVLGMNGDWEVFGSDISRSVLATASRGLYEMPRIRGLPENYLRKYCLKGINSQAGSLLIDPQLRGHVRFAQINLQQPVPDVGYFDVIFLRNVMIYFDQPTKRHVVANICQRLVSGGHFIVGHSESLNGIADGLELVRPTIYRRPP